MKKYILIFLSLFILFSCNNEKKEKGITTDIVNIPENPEGTDSTSLPIISFKQTDFNFGTVYAGEKVTHTYKFKNTGKADLVIIKATPSCGCTVPSFTKEPIPPGGEGKVEVVFDSSNRQGVENKKVTVLTNAQPSAVVLTFSVEVIKE